ncbi:amidohydrolase family protein [Helcococcus bovis]|uniref:amidohydrolase family protein n=1 Tax=Helcococcus bovis TaxID=3153252 RepID=UPI0038BD680F
MQQLQLFWGGYTTIIDMPLQNEPALTNDKLFDIKEEKVSKEAYSDYCFWGGFVPENFYDLKGLDEKGVVAFKSFLGPVSPDYTPLSYGKMYEGLEILKELDARAGFHAEDFSVIKERERVMQERGRLDWEGFLDSRPLSAELIATRAVVDIAKELNAKVHICHVSHPDVAKIVKDAQDEGYDITAETCAHYLTFTREDVIKNGELFKCAPPLRDQKAVEGMWEHVKMGTFSGIATDHSPCSYDEKYKEILGQKINNVFDVWGGMSGVQSGVQAVISEGINKRGVSPSIIVEAMCVKPAKTFGIYGRKGDIKEGFDADLIIVDLEKEWEITSEELLYVNKMSGYVGLKGKGKTVTTILRGKVVAEDGKVVGEAGYGELIKKIK